MVMVLGAILWLTIVGANVPSGILATLLVDQGHALLTGWFVAAGAPDWVRGLVRRWHVSGHRLGDRRDVAADGDFFPVFHAAGGFRIPAARGLQSRPGFPKSRSPRQAGAHHGHGPRLQCGGRGGHPHHRLAARTAHRHHHEQLLALQRPLAHADPDGQRVHRHARARKAGAARSPRSRCWSSRC